MKKARFALLIIAIALFASNSYAAQFFNNDTELGHSNEINCSTNVDCTITGGKAVVSMSGNVLNKTDATLTLASSSTIITGTNVPFALIRKSIGGNGADNSGVGTELANGTEGAVLIIQADSVASGGSWVVTPDTKTGFDSLTFDAAKERATLMYVDDTIGWIIISVDGTTVNLTL